MQFPLAEEGIQILGTAHESIDRVEDRERFTEVLNLLEIPQAEYGIAYSFEDARLVAERIGFPVLVRPSYVLGGRAMEIVYDDTELKEYMKEAVKISPEHPILVDKFLEDAIEIDVDALSDGEEVFIGGIMEHIEEAGVHSGDSACVMPPQSISKDVLKTIKEYIFIKWGRMCMSWMGSNLFADFGIASFLHPHWNNAEGAAALDQVVVLLAWSASESGAIFSHLIAKPFGLDEHTGLIMDFESGQCEVSGVSSISFVRECDPEIFPSGSHFPLSRAGRVPYS